MMSPVGTFHRNDNSAIEAGANKDGSGIRNVFPHPAWGVVKPRVASIWKLFFPNLSPFEYLEVLNFYLNNRSRVLEVGAGAGHIHAHGIKEKVAQLVGLDPDLRVLNNPQLHRGVVGICENMPFESNHFDVVFHRMLSEHLTDPAKATGEMARVLKPGGYLIFHAPNRWHYSMIISRFTPMWFHRVFISYLGTRKNKDDIHPTFYRMNDLASIRKICRNSGLEIQKVLFMEAPPCYFRFSSLTFFVASLYVLTIERFISCLRPTMVIVARKIV